MTKTISDEPIGYTFGIKEPPTAPAQDHQEGVKKDGGKLRMDLIPPDVEEGWAKILTYGTKDYADRNWELGMDWGRIYAAARRHLMAFWAGEDNDRESGLPHIDHALCCLTFLSAYQKRGVGLDNRNKIMEKK